MMKRGSGTTANERGEVAAGSSGSAGGSDDGSRLRPGEVMNQRMFEDRWLRLPQLSSRHDTFLPPVPAMSDIKLHFKGEMFLHCFGLLSCTLNLFIFHVFMDSFSNFFLTFF